MLARGLDGLFVSEPANMAWLTGYDGWSFYVHQGVLLTHDHDPIWWGRAQDKNGALRTVWMHEDCLRPYPESMVQNPNAHPMEDLARQLAEYGLSETRIGLEMDNYYFTGKALDTLREKLPQAELVDATNLCNWQRVTKSDEELAFMRKAGKITEKIIKNVLKRVEPGIPKNEIVAGIYHDGIMGAEDAWGDYPSIVPLLPSGQDASAPHLTWDGRPFQSGQATFFEVSGCYRRYHTPYCRTIFLGTPPSDLVAAEQALIAGLSAGIEAARAGNRACDVAIALKAELKKVGIEREGRVGYPVGLTYPPDWGEHTVSLRESDETILQPGMTFHFMPGLWTKDWGLEITETIAIAPEGPAECLVECPRQLYVKP